MLSSAAYLKGFEPPAFAFVAQCSIRLSYRYIFYCIRLPCSLCSLFLASVQLHQVFLDSGNRLWQQFNVDENLITLRYSVLHCFPFVLFFEPRPGIEPGALDYETNVLPLNYRGLRLYRFWYIIPPDFKPVNWRRYSYDRTYYFIYKYSVSPGPRWLATWSMISLFTALQHFRLR